LQKTILISGASSGIGRATAIRLAHDGYKVLAGVRNQDAANELLATVPQNVEPVFFDITDEASLDKFFLRLRTDIRRQWAIRGSEQRWYRPVGRVRIHAG